MFGLHNYFSAGNLNPGIFGCPDFFFICDLKILNSAVVVDWKGDPSRSITILVTLLSLLRINGSSDIID